MKNNLAQIILLLEENAKLQDKIKELENVILQLKIQIVYYENKIQ